MFYVYRHIRLDTNLPFYVGKGTKYRAWAKAGRNPYWQRIVKKHGYRVELMIQNIPEKKAFQKEIEFIRLYKKLGYCQANMTDGGEGISNPSEEVLLKLRNHVFSDEHRKKLSEVRKGRKFPRKKHSNDERRNHLKRPKLKKYKQKLVPKVGKICRVCGDIFTGNKNAVYCSPYCKLKKQRDIQERKIKRVVELDELFNSTPIICNETLERYKSINQAAELLSLKSKEILSVILGSQRWVRGKLTFTYLT